jgi:hypothetical protein
LSGVVNAAGMLEPLTTDKLMEEVDRYLAAVDLFRELACEPAWRSELPVEGRQPSAAAATTSALDVEQLH